MDLRVRPEDQTPELSEKSRTLTKAEKSKTVAVQSQNHVDLIPRCEGHRPQRDLVAGLDDYQTRLQRDTAAFASYSALEEARIVAGQLVAASP